MMVFQKIILKSESETGFDDLTGQLTSLGYERTQIVVSPGDFSVKGGLIDVYPLNQTHPLRIEFLGEKIDSIRSFDIHNQRSISKITETTIETFIKENQQLIHSSNEDLSNQTIISDIEVGAYVVHQHHGIARFGGLKRQSFETTFGTLEGEFLDLEFANNDRIFTPLEQIKWVHKYSSSKLNPTLSSLNDQKWKKAKAKAKKSTDQIANDLFQMYKIRMLQEGHSFSEDSLWQIELEKDFPYQETKDQAAAIVNVKKDMESKRPMDRLICGDVGYGKTEIALRAAFKAAIDNKQVAIVAPTTILAQQHYGTFVKRFEPFKHKVALLSRFVTKKDQKKIIEDLKSGTIDVVIGTHRLFQKDINFADLGLVIIDEEHRFGVKHKEHFKKLRTQVDVLSLSATPIPRSLHLSLTGSKDISILQTPPKNRYPIETFIGTHDQNLITKVIRQELKRGGQTFYLSNRVKEINQTHAELSRLVPEAKFAIGHGQMPGHQLEAVMINFLERKSDVLVCSTIIESGIDIPNANTLIIEDADNFGLSQLHQIRGRIGRTNRHAYCYLFYDPKKLLNTQANERLHTIKEYAALGSGFKIAMRDLEIRGAGNILGTQQSGNIIAIGFQLFTKLLEESVQEAKGEKISKDKNFNFSKKKSAFIPGTYVPDDRQRIALYKRIMDVKSASELEKLKEEMADRFGPIPEEVDNLLMEMVTQL